MSGKSLANLIVKNLKTHGVADVARMAWQRLAGGKYEIPAKLGMVVVEVTTYCNLKCAGCVRTIMDQQDSWSNTHMPVESFRRVIESLPPAELFIPQGIGESTMHPDIVELIRIAAAARKFDRIEMNTNALVRTADFYAELFNAGLGSLTVSVDTLDDGLIERVRSGTDIAKLETRLHEFAQRFPDKMGVRITVSKWNVGQLPALFRRLESLGHFKVYLQPFFDMGNGGGVLEADDVGQLEASVAEQRGEYPNLEINIEPFLPSKEVCRSPWGAPAVTVEGYLKPCCMILHQEEIHFGNVLKAPFGELWHSPEVEEFRSQFIKRSPDCCARCPYYLMRR